MNARWKVSHISGIYFISPFSWNWEGDLPSDTFKRSCFESFFLKKSGYYMKIILIGQPILHVPFVDKNTYLVSKRDDGLLLSRSSQDQPRLITAAAGPPLIRQQPGGPNKQECLHVMWKALWSASMRVRERVCVPAQVSLCAPEV